MTASDIIAVFAALAAIGAAVFAWLSWVRAGQANATAGHANTLSGEANEIAARALALQEEMKPEPWSELSARRAGKISRIGSIQNNSGRTVQVINVEFPDKRVDPRISYRTESVVDNGDRFEFVFVSNSQKSIVLHWGYVGTEHVASTPRNIIRVD